MLKACSNGVLLSIKVAPKAKNSAIMGREQEHLKLRIAALPEKGEANLELVIFLSKIKMVCLEGLTLLEAENLLLPYLS